MSSGLNFNPSTSATQSASQTQWAQAKSEFQQLGQALSSGDLSAAQSAFNALQQNAPQGASSQSGQGNAGQSPFAALGQALQSGNLSAAQQAYSQIQQTKGQHRHHHQGESQSSDSTAAAATPAVPDASGTTGTSVNVTA
jgi:outer membrane protein assembly factor BamD (BamD/ComL family)